MRRYPSVCLAWLAVCAPLVADTGGAGIGVGPASAPSSLAAPEAPLPPDSAYVRAIGPHLFAEGQRLRFWGVIGNFPYPPEFTAGDDAAARRAKTETAYAANRALADRFEFLGFNAHRLWHPRSLARLQPYTPGDGSYIDVVDHFAAELKRRGFRLWFSAFNSLGEVLPEDVSILEEPATAEAWRAAIVEWRAGEGGKARVPAGTGNLARIWDPRIEALSIERMRRMADHRNLHTGLRYADDPVFAVWEITNEEWWVPKMVAGRWRSLPRFFQDSLVARWNDFLHAKYPDEAALLARWRFLLPGESYADRTLQLAPYRQGENDVAFNDGSWLAVRSLQSGPPPAATRDEVVRARSEDVLEFFQELVLAHKRRVAAALKPLGRSTALSPWVYDTGMGHDAASHRIQQEAEAASYCSYTVGWTTDRGHPRYPFFSGLEEPPRTGNEIPWFEHNRPENTPYLAYETQIQQPAKYRAEYPLRLLALAATNDWDWINWHYWGPVPDIASAERPFDRALDVTTGEHPQGYHFTFDEVQAAPMRAAALAFRHGLLAPAASPTVFIFGRRSLFAPEAMDYAGAFGGLARGADMSTTTYQFGSRLRIDPRVELDSIEGPFLRAQIHGTRLVYRPTPQIEFNPRRGYLRLDAPGFGAYTGFLADYGAPVVRLPTAGLELSEVEFASPDHMPYPVTKDEGYVAFTAASGDGHPLAESARIELSLVSTSFNTGFQMGERPVLYRPGPGTKAGKAPVLVTRVGATVGGAALAGRRYVFRDWHGRTLAEGQVGPDGVLRIPAQLPVWVVELTQP